MNLAFLAPMGFSKDNGSGVFEIPFLDRMGFVFLICVIGMVLISLVQNARGVKTKGLEIDRSMFKMSSSFAVGALIICGVLAALYTLLW